MSHTPNDGTAETTAGKWPPRDRDPHDPVCDSEERGEQARESDRPKTESR